MTVSRFDTSEVSPPLLAAEVSVNASLSWNFQTVPQAGLNGRTIDYNRGRVVGGSSSISTFHHFSFDVLNSPPFHFPF